MVRKTALLLMICLVWALTGCAKPETAITKSYEIEMKTDKGSNVLVLVLDADVDSKTAVDQVAKSENRGQLQATIPSRSAAAASAAGGLIDAITKPEPEKVTPAPIPLPDKTTEAGSYRGRTNGNRATWYFSRRMTEYPDTFQIEIVGCKTLNVKNNGHRYDAGGGYLVKQSDVPGRGMAVLAAADCTSQTARI